MRRAPVLRAALGAGFCCVALLPLLAGCSGDAAPTAIRRGAVQRPHAATRPAAAAHVPVHVPMPAAARVQAGAPAVTDLFGVTSWVVAAPPPPEAAPVTVAAPATPPPPSAPPLPFKYLGRYGDAELDLVMLLKGERLYLVKPGDTIENLYRLERVGAGVIELTYLPLKLRQSLSSADPT